MAKNSKPSSGRGAAGRGVDLVQVERILEFMHKHGLEEFEYERDGLRVRMRKPAAVAPGGFRTIPSSDIVIATAAGQAQTNALPEVRPPAAEPEEGISEDLHVVKSPIVGTFYASSSPEAEPFVTVGSHVEVGQVLCIIEAMKLMNEIESDVTGEVARIFVENGHPVEYGEPLFGIHPHRKK